jgi:type IV secretion system protein VirB11
MTHGDPAPGVYLSHYLSLLGAFLGRGDVTDLYVNRPGEIWLETLAGATERHDVPELSSAMLARLAEQVAAHTHQGISRSHPLLAATMPGGERAQFVAPPATRGPMALAIRKHQARNLTLESLAATGAFDVVAQDAGASREKDKAALVDLKARGQFTALLAAAVRQRHNILVSGGTSTGKTTFLNALLREIAREERVIVIEDTPELDIVHDNAVGLVAARSALGEAVVDMDSLLNAALRMRPDRIILGELRGPEAFTFLRAVNTGHPGSMTTIHADNPGRAVEQIALLVLQTGTSLDRESVVHYVRSTIDVFVQLERRGGRRYVSAVELAS